jgi:outer membrane protein assembly factor BamB
MRRAVSWSFAAACLVTAGACSSSDAGSTPGAAGASPVGSASVLQYHNSSTRDGVYVAPALTRTAVAAMHRDSTFNASIEGPTYAQPLYVDGGATGRDSVIVATEQNLVYSLDAANGAVMWQQQLGPPATLAGSGICGNVDPVGITGTPVIDPASRTLYVAAMTGGGTTARRHLVFALSVDDGTPRPGWPVDVSGVQSAGLRFNAPYENQRGALLLLGGMVYVPYGGHSGDCGDYHGWVVAVPVDNPSGVRGFATAARGGGIWAPGGLASDGVSVFAATGNTMGATTWGHGEAILRLQPGAVFGGATADYFTPSNWRALDSGDADLGGSGPLLVDLPAGAPSRLVVALGKNGVAYLLDRSNLAGVGAGDGTIGEGIDSAKVISGPIINAAAAYTTSQGTYVVMRGAGVACPAGAGDLAAIKISATTPPRISVAWCARENGRGSPMVTTTDGHANAVVWAAGAEAGDRLMGFDGDTGQVLFGGGGAAEAMSNVRRFSTPIAAKGRIFVVSDTAVYAFTTR